MHFSPSLRPSQDLPQNNQGRSPMIERRALLSGSVTQLPFNQVVALALSALAANSQMTVGIGHTDGRGYWFNMAEQNNYVVDEKFTDTVKKAALQSGLIVKETREFHTAESRKFSHAVVPLAQVHLFLVGLAHSRL